MVSSYTVRHAQYDWLAQQQPSFLLHYVLQPVIGKCIEVLVWSAGQEPARYQFGRLRKEKISNA